MNEVAEIIKSIINTPGKKDKEKIISENKDNELFKTVLNHIYNPYIKTNIAKKKLMKNINSSPKIVFNSVVDYIDYLTKTTGKDSEIVNIQAYIKSQPEEIRWLLEALATKELKIGATSKTINKGLGYDFIPSFSVQLAESYAKKGSRVKGEFYLTQKLDGNRIVAIKHNNNVEFFTRKGLTIEGLDELAECFKLLPDNRVYDGEILLVNNDNLSSDDLFRSTQKVLKSKGKKENLEMFIFDTLPFEDFKKGKSLEKYSERREYLDSLKDKVTGFLHILPVLYKGNDKNKITELMNWVEENHFEGLMMNMSDGIYECKRVSSLLKIKKFNSCDGIIKDIYEGDGKYKGMLGGVYITFNDIVVKIGSGFTDAERKNYWENPDLIIGKVGCYQYFEKSKNQDGGTDLRFATWKGIREDKGEEDVNYE